MSFILDALRKSDAERQRAATPGLADVRYATPRSHRNLWLPILAVVLGINVVFMGLQWWKHTPAAPGQGAPPAAGPVTQPPTDSAAVPAPASNIRSLARETEFGEPQLEPAPAGQLPDVPVVTEAAESAARIAPPIATPANPAPNNTPRILPNNALPSVEEIIGSGTVKIPMLNLDLHVYSERAAGRFVVINSRKYKEGSQLTEGPTVESITADGVILASQGRRFTLSRK